MTIQNPQDLFRGAAHIGAQVGLESDIFEPNWQIGRGLHNDGHLKDALPYLEKAHELAPDHAQAHGRLIELYLDLHEEHPAGGHDITALRLVSELIKTEDSEYAHELHTLARAYVGLRDLEDGIHRRLD